MCFGLVGKENYGGFYGGGNTDPEFAIRKEIETVLGRDKDMSGIIGEHRRKVCSLP